MKEDMALHLPLPCLLPSEIDFPVGNKQRRNKQGGDEYMEVWGSFLQMKTG
jgi:hypothetical protein